MDQFYSLSIGLNIKPVQPTGSENFKESEQLVRVLGKTITDAISVVYSVRISPNTSTALNFLGGINLQMLLLESQSMFGVKIGDGPVLVLRTLCLDYQGEGVGIPDITLSNPNTDNLIPPITVNVLSLLD